MQLGDWDVGLVDLVRAPLPGWRGESNARMRAALHVSRRPGKTIASIFIPLMASLLIPLLAMWLNRTEENGEFKIEAFELTNIVIGGLFAVIALNFTVMSTYSTLGSGENTVTRLFALNYVTLAFSLLVNLALFRFNVLKRLLGAHIQIEVYRFLMWAIPLLAFSTAGAMVLVAMA